MLRLAHDAKIAEVLRLEARIRELQAVPVPTVPVETPEWIAERTRLNDELLRVKALNISLEGRLQVLRGNVESANKARTQLLRICVCVCDCLVDGRVCCAGA